MIAGRLKRPVAFQQRGVEFIGAFDGRAQHRRTNAVKRAPPGIQHQQPLGGEDPGIERRKSLGESMARLIGRGQRLRGFGIAKQLGCRVDESRNRIVQRDGAYGTGRRGRTCVLQLAQLTVGGKGDVVDLCKVVIFSGQPENGGVRTTGLCGLAGTSQRSGRFEGRE